MPSTDRVSSGSLKRALVALALAIAVALSGAAFLSKARTERSKSSKIGKLTPIGCVNASEAATDTCAKHTLGLANATALAISSDGRSIYVVTEGLTLVRLKRSPGTGKLSPRGCIENTGAATGCSASADGLLGVGAVTVSPDGKSVYAAGEGGTIVAFKRNRSSGKLTSRGCVEDNDTGPGACAKTANGLDGATSVVVSPDGKSVYVSSESDSAVVRFNRNRSSGRLTPKGCIADINDGADACAQHTKGLSSPGALAISRDGKSLYAASENGAIARFKRDRSGKITPGGCVEDNDNLPSLGCGKSTNGLTHPEALAVSYDGRSVYAASGNSESALVTFKRSRSGKLTPKGCIDDNDISDDTCARTTNGMEEGAGVAISRDGRSVYYSSAVDDAIVRFQRSRNSGKLTPKGCIDDNDTGTDPVQGEDDCLSSTNSMYKLSAVVMSRDGKSVYATSETDSAVTGFKRKTG